MSRNTRYERILDNHVGHPIRPGLSRATAAWLVRCLLGASYSLPPHRTNLSSTRGAAGETPASPGDPVEQRALVTLELDFCALEQAGTRAALNESDEMDDEEG
jgi:hypothetical protein